MPECGMMLAGPAIAELLTWLRAGQVPQEQPLIIVLERAPLPRRSGEPTQQTPIAGEMLRILVDLLAASCLAAFLAALQIARWSRCAASMPDVEKPYLQPLL